MTTLKQLKEQTNNYEVLQHNGANDQKPTKWGSFGSLESAKKEAIECAAHRLGTEHGQEFSVHYKDKNGTMHNPHHFAVHHRPHNGGSYVWDKRSGKTVKEL